ncbi:sugar phosphate isomerase/epimerase [Limosilactobacillus reuteri]|uniref:sugar phosphate isomerase/epimerase family protein n=1 Tax=Limosilactobacillus reuteri TaxID=1598 RepID=UPI001E2C1954|nr:sugar phosphate isomerase/epimerase [Limosilactobacillus reuteri]MCC4510802.1 sugar phosphate isomerase/epimerase [Limosilactobacillus reuteri]
MTLILNTWIFEKDIQKGTSQVDLVDRVKKLGADGLEVRREYFKDFDTELTGIHEAAQRKNMIINYSVPDVIFEKDGSINPNLSKYFDEGKRMGINKIKFNTGNFENYTGNLVKDFSRLPLAEIKMNVENDQTPISGTPDAIYAFLTNARKAGLNSIGYVYDLGNWAFTGFNAIEAAKKLAPFCDYIHLKNSMLDSDGNMITTNNLDKGMFNWQIIINYLPKDVQYALEYPMDNDELISQQIKLFNTKR